MTLVKTVLLLLLLILSTAAVSAQKHQPPLLSFYDLQKYDPATNIFRIEGFVLDIYKCPPCPPHMMCKPCIPDNITLVDSAQRNDLSKLKRLRVYTKNTDSFKLNGKYRLTVKVKNGLAAGSVIESVDLISIDKSLQR